MSAASQRRVSAAAGNTAGTPANHVVDSTIFEFSSIGRSTAWIEEGQLADIVRAELIPVVEQVLDEIDPGGRTLAFGNLEVDLGSLVVEGGWSHVRQRLREELHVALKNAGPGSGIDRHSESQRILSGDGSAADLELSRHYLRFGLLPRDIRILQRPEMERRLIEAARSEPDRFVALMREPAAAQTVIARLVRQYPDAFLERLAGALDSTAGALVAGFAGLLEKAIRVILNGSMPAQEIRGLIWSRVLGELASRRQKSAAPGCARILQALAAELDRPRAELLAQLSRQMPVSEPLLSLIRDTLRLADSAAGSEGHAGDVAAPASEAGDTVTNPAEAERRGAPVANRDRLMAELDQGRPGAAGRLLDLLASDTCDQRAITRGLDVAAHRLLLEEVLHRTGGGGDVIPFLQAVARHAHRSNDEQAFYQAVFEQLLRREPVDLESIALEIGHVDIAQTEIAQPEIAQPEIAQPEIALGKGRERADRSSDVTPKVSQFARDDVAPDFGEERAGDASAPVFHENQDLVRAYDLFAFLARTASETVPPADRVSTTQGDRVAELARLSPILIRRLLLELRAGVVTLSLLCASLRETELRSLVHVLVPPGTGCDEADCRRLLQAIDRHAGEAGERRAFYQKLLQRLADRTLIDLEAIAAETGRRLERHPAGAGLPDRKPDEAPHERIRQKLEPSRNGSSEQEIEKILLTLQKHLLGEAGLPDAGKSEAERALEQAVAVVPGRARVFLQGLAGNELALGRLVEWLPERLLPRLLQVLAPSHYESILRAADTVANACHGAVGAWGDPGQVNQLKWRYCLQYLLEPGVAREDRVFVRGLIDHLVGHLDLGDATQRYRQLRQGAIEMDPANAALFTSDEITGPATVSRDQSRMDGDRASSDSFEAEYLEVLAQGVAVDNAGLVLTSPYLPRLFDLLGLLEKGSFRNIQAQARAAQLLQYLVDEHSDAPDYRLVLNKVLCGLDVKHPLQAYIEVTEREKEAMEGLLKGMIGHWEVLKSTSVNGLREAFLQRDGTLRRDQDGWRLSVEPKAYDMLLDQLPWGYSIIRHPWMEGVVHVDWR